MDDIVSFLRFYYPHIEEESWRYDSLNLSDRFQKSTLNLDCGFHILHFMHCALKNIRIPLSHAQFNLFKSRINNSLLKLQNDKSTLPTKVSAPEPEPDDSLVDTDDDTTKQT